jgi:DNA repair exonuclease SbcCD nuclease subunit
MKILHTADIHLIEYGDSRWKTLRKLIELGKAEKIEIFVVSGDLFDKNIDAEKLRPKIREVFSNTGFKIILIPGNHDSNSFSSEMYFGEDVVILKDLYKPFEYKDVRIWGLPFEPIEEEKVLNKLHSLADKLAKDKVNILLFHGELLDVFFRREDFGEEGEERYMPVKLLYFEDLNIDYILAGHFHSKFDVWKLENGGYFVYPGSPISITKRETGQRKVNIFEVGKPPTEYFLNTPCFEEVFIEFDPFIDKSPVEMVEEALKNTLPESIIVLTIAGYINSEKIKINESNLVELIKEITKGKTIAEEHLEFKDIHTILEDDLFKSFIKKIEEGEYDQGKKKQLRNVAIEAMMKARS